MQQTNPDPGEYFALFVNDRNGSASNYHGPEKRRIFETVARNFRGQIELAVCVGTDPASTHTVKQQRHEPSERTSSLVNAHPNTLDAETFPIR